MMDRVTYPTTAQDMLDRLIADRAFRIRLIVADNFPAVKELHDQELLLGNSSDYGPEQLTANLLWLDAQPDGEELVDRVTAVPYRGTANSRVLTDAMAMGEHMLREAGAEPKNLFAGLAAGIGGIVSGIGNIANGRHTTAATERVATREITTNAILEAEKSARRERLMKLAIISATVVAVIAILIIFRKR